MSASGRAAERITKETKFYSVNDATFVKEASAIIAAEYAPLVNACHTLLMTYANNSLHSNDMNRFLKDIRFTQALAHIEGDATP